ncbi:MAG: mucoidy inhibitor MuiA family protein, partial [Propionibacteriaceae bacterium]|nr:mucoidy inhibitor MuiA family protein [Propionibacteriaceae bacterium]
MVTTLSTEIVSVTVYPGQARITRRGSLTLPAGEGSLEVLITDLPLSLISESARVTGRGTGTITGLDVRVSHHAADDAPRIAALLAERQRLAVRAQEIVDQRRTLDLRATLIESVASEAGRPYARQLASGKASTDLAPAGEQLAAQLAEVLAARRTLLDDERDLSEQQDRIDRELAGEGATSPDRTEIAVAVQPGAGGELELEVSYVVDGANWESRYDLRLDEAGDQVAVTWFGMVRQWSGEDWPACELRLSTARPSMAIAIPDLDPWFLSQPVFHSGAPA